MLLISAAIWTSVVVRAQAVNGQGVRPTYICAFEVTKTTGSRLTLRPLQRHLFRLVFTFRLGPGCGSCGRHSPRSFSPLFPMSSGSVEVSLLCFSGLTRRQLFYVPGMTSDVIRASKRPEKTVSRDCHASGRASYVVNLLDGAPTNKIRLTYYGRWMQAVHAQRFEPCISHHLFKLRDHIICNLNKCNTHRMSLMHCDSAAP